MSVPDTVCRGAKHVVFESYPELGNNYGQRGSWWVFAAHARLRRAKDPYSSGRMKMCMPGKPLPFRSNAVRSDYKSSRTQRIVILLTGCATVLVMVSQLFSLTKYPPVHVDESWYANAAWNWLTTGVSFDSMHAGTLDRYGHGWLRWPVIGNLPLLASFAALGLGLLQARLVSWVFGALLLLATALVGRRSYGLLTGVLAALLLSLSVPFLQSSHLARPDIILATAVMVAYLCALKAFKKDRWWAHVLAGLLLGLSVDIHPNGLLFALALAAVYWVNYGSGVLKQTGTWLCAAGGLLGIAFYAIVHVLPNPSAFLSLRSLNLAYTHTPPLLTWDPVNLLASAYLEIGRFRFHQNIPGMSLIAISIAYLIHRRRKVDRLLLAFVGVAFVAFVLFVANKYDYYAILLYPFLMLMVAEVLVSLLGGQRRSKWLRILVATLLTATVVIGTMQYIRPTIDTPLGQYRASIWDIDYNYYDTTQKIEGVVPEGARVLGRPAWWLGLADYDFRSSFNLTYYHILSGYSLTEGLEAIRPDIVIVDDIMRSNLVDEGYYSAERGLSTFYRLPRREFEGFLAQRGEKLLELTDLGGGRLVIYAIHWD